MNKNIKKILTFGLILAVVVVMFLYSAVITDFFLGLFGGEKDVVVKPVALIEQVIDNVKLKRSVSTVWNPAVVKKQLGVMDSLSTGDESRSLIRFNNGFDMGLEERSLIVIEEPQDQSPEIAEVLLEDGEITLDNEKSGTALLRVRAGNTVSEIQGKSAIIIKFDKVQKKAEVFVKKGKAKVTDDKGGELLINENESQSFSTEAITPPPPPMPEPEPVVETPPAPEPEPVVVKEAPKPERKLTKADIYKTLSKHGKRLNACYDARAEYVKGKRLFLLATIENTGKVIGLKTTKSEIKDKITDTCLKRVVWGMRFPKFDGAPVKENIYLVFSEE